MIYELISNGSHNNNVALYRCSSNNGILYRKVAFTKKANNIIGNEKTGYDWFSRLTDRSIKTKIIENHFYEIEIPEFKGRRFPRNAKIDGNEKFIEKLINFYQENWSQTDEFAIHGDMALCNVIIGHNGTIELVDWEHFHFAEKEYFGFDIFNMFYILLTYQIKSANRIKNKTREFLKESYKGLCDSAGASNKILEKPFTLSNRYLKENQSKFLLNVPLERKYVLASCLESELEKLDLIVT